MAVTFLLLDSYTQLVPGPTLYMAQRADGTRSQPGRFMGLDSNYVILKPIGGTDFWAEKDTSRFYKRIAGPPPPATAPIPPEPLPKKNVPVGTKNSITYNTIEHEDVLVNFHGEAAQGRYYARSTYNQLDPKINPFTRKRIEPENVTTYRAVQRNKSKSKSKTGGKRRPSSSKRATRKYRHHRKH